MNKKKIIAMSIILLCLILSAIGIIWFLVKDDDKTDLELAMQGKSGYEQAAESLDVDYNADIMVYGEEPGFIDDVKWRKIDKITEEILNFEEPHGYRAIILFDYEGTMNITDEELLLIKKYVEEKGYDMIYIGENYLDDFVRLKFTVGCKPGAMSLGYMGSINVGQEVQQNEVGNLYALHGIWNVESEEYLKMNEILLQSTLLDIMWMYAKQSNGYNPAGEFSGEE